jgi:F0F1-type ATP synthase assembly protein I
MKLPRRIDSAKLSSESMRKLGLYTTIPTMMVVGPVLGWLLGSWLEKRWGHDPWFSTGGAVLGTVAAFRQVIMVLQRAEEPPEDEN